MVSFSFWRHVFRQTIWKPEYNLKNSNTKKYNKEMHRDIHSVRTCKFEQFYRNAHSRQKSTVFNFMTLAKASKGFHLIANVKHYTRLQKSQELVKTFPVCQKIETEWKNISTKAFSAGLAVRASYKIEHSLLLETSVSQGFDIKLKSWF